LQAQFVDLLGRSPDSDDEEESAMASSNTLSVWDLIAKVGEGMYSTKT